MSEWIKAQIPTLSETALANLVVDVERRIGSHVAGGNIDEHYVAKQQSILDAVQNELGRRKI